MNTHSKTAPQHELHCLPGNNITEHMCIMYGDWTVMQKKINRKLKKSEAKITPADQKEESIKPGTVT